MWLVQSQWGRGRGRGLEGTGDSSYHYHTQNKQVTMRSSVMSFPKSRGKNALQNHVHLVIEFSRVEEVREKT